MKLVVEVLGDFLVNNDDAPGPGRVWLLADHGEVRRPVGTLGYGRWLVDHKPGRGWSVDMMTTGGRRR